MVYCTVSIALKSCTFGKLRLLGGDMANNCNTAKLACKRGRWSEGVVINWGDEQDIRDENTRAVEATSGHSRTILR